MSQYITFPPKPVLLERLRLLGDGSAARDELYQRIAERFAARTCEKAAFAFLLIETLHQNRHAVEEDLGEFLPRCILGLCGDEELARSARSAFRELKEDRSGS